jgi:hypothetical protein
MALCPHCHHPVFRVSRNGDRAKARTPILVLHKSGEAEINCPNCKKAVIVGKMEETRLEKVFQRPKFIISPKKP